MNHVIFSHNLIRIHHSVQKTRFLRTPLQRYKRISSYFSYHRYDPILRKIKPHLGIDFAAPLGTPIKSIGDGQIVFLGYRGGYGKTIQVRYSRHCLALYGHMLKFAKVHLYSWVHKGEIIGYVGKSGWATGPHLHFGFYVNGKPQNWLSVQSLM
ncbi:M23 family metallopeptidase [Coxiella endosymbiont of Amblyomma sculptum]|uniref:M23 family metallopeptidase n=1 Tax=Coxiella endosymbiont of Amblyomma sculptum TaxID=2487929 RepID=UPI00132F4387|nr:M23 family metallopeptidase [Coxiella endosymbiont of Amblyomma sculptum]QHG92420.1 M23 family metallopeptidase [Coxiella endosymbiont of Amblyomma sculptum]